MVKINKINDKNKKRRGRPPHVPTEKTRERVERYTMCKMTHIEIAHAIGIDVHTLKKYYPNELLYGSSKKRGEVYDMLFASAKMGNVSAQRKLASMVEGDKLTAADLKEIEEETKGKSKKLGKKEQAAVDANDVADKYVAPEPPKLVVDNS